MILRRSKALNVMVRSSRELTNVNIVSYSLLTFPLSKVIFLSMVCSPGRAPSQSQVVHFQRSNVAMSRARDQCILVRSLDISDIPSTDDVKIPIIEFFQRSASRNDISSTEKLLVSGAQFMSEKNALLNLLVDRLSDRGYKLCSMGVVWKNGICVEHPECDERVALVIDDVSETYQDWVCSYRQQQKIEGVGWKCLRIDIFSFLSDCNGTMQSIIDYLKQVGIGSVEDKTSVAVDSVSKITDGYNNDTELQPSLTVRSSDGPIACMEQRDEIALGKSLTIKANRSTKRPRTHRNSKTKPPIDLNDVAEAEVESLISIDTQSNSNDDNIVVDLSFLRGR